MGLEGHPLYDMLPEVTNTRYQITWNFCDTLISRFCAFTCEFPNCYTILSAVLKIFSPFSLRILISLQNLGGSWKVYNCRHSFPVFNHS